MPKLDLPKLAVAILEDKVKAVIGDEAVKQIKSPLLETELRNSLVTATEKAEHRWLTEYSDQEVCALVKEMPLADLPSIREAIRSFYDHPTTPVTTHAFRNQLTSLVPKGFAIERIESAITSYMEILREELVSIEVLRDKLNALANIETAQNTSRTVYELRQIKQLLEKNNQSTLSRVERNQKRTSALEQSVVSTPVTKSISEVERLEPVRRHEIASKIQEFINQARVIYEEALNEHVDVKRQDISWGEENLARWKFKVLRYTDNNISENEAQSFLYKATSIGGYPVDQFTNSYNAHINFLAALSKEVDENFDFPIKLTPEPSGISYPTKLNFTYKAIRK